MSISTKFETFCNNLRISNENLEKISYRYHQITRRINLDYWNIQSDTNHSLYEDLLVEILRFLQAI